MKLRPYFFGFSNWCAMLEISRQNISDVAPRLDLLRLDFPEKQILNSFSWRKCSLRLGIVGAAGVISHWVGPDISFLATFYLGGDDPEP